MVTQPNALNFQGVGRPTIIGNMFRANVAGHVAVRFQRSGGTGSANWTFGLSAASSDSFLAATVYGPNGNGIVVDGAGRLAVDASGVTLGVTGSETENGNPTALHLKVGGLFDDGLAALTAGRTGNTRITPNHALHVNLRNQAGTELTSFPVTGTFFQATQPVSIAGTVTSRSIVAHAFSTHVDARRARNETRHENFTPAARIDREGEILVALARA